MRAAWFVGGVFAVGLGVPSVAQAICDTCCRGAPRACTLPNGAPGHAICSDGIWDGCEPDPPKLSLALTTSDGRQVSTVNGFVQGSTGTLFRGQRDSVSLSLYASDPVGMPWAYVSVRAVATCGKATNALSTIERTGSVFPAVPRSPAVYTGTISVLLAASRWWDAAVAPCPDGSPADELEMFFRPYALSSAGVWRTSAEVSVRLVATIRLVTWNIRHGSQGHDDYCAAHGTDPACVDIALQRQQLVGLHPDIVLLQEVMEGCYSGQQIQETSYLASAGFPYSAFFLEDYGVPGCWTMYSTIGAYGESILSRFPFSSTQNYDLPFALYKHGGLGRANVSLPPFEFSVFTLHPGGIGGATWDTAKSVAQHDLICQKVLEQGVSATHSVIWGGDFNNTIPQIDTYYSPSFLWTTSIPFYYDNQPMIWCSQLPRQDLSLRPATDRIDHLFGWSVVPFHVVGGQDEPDLIVYSDHSAVTGVFRLDSAL